MGASQAVFAKEKGDPVAEAKMTLEQFQKTDPGSKKFMDTSSGYAVFPSVGKGGLGVGGARGHGVLFDKGGAAVAKVKITQVTVGLQAGGQEFSEVIFFETPAAFEEFRKGDFTLAAQVSAIALKEGASADAAYKRGVAVFTLGKGGLMFEAAVGGQKFKVEPL
jgi:lipid-binding SYLF domain-containing protein